jgi:oxalate decarboxylase/phosphoglucose isomerase-like protein (cupin superfamily)
MDVLIVSLPVPTSGGVLIHSYWQGNARATVFASSVNARTFDYPGGDIGMSHQFRCIDLLFNKCTVYVPPTTFGHYVENTSNATLKYLEIFNSNIYEDFSLNQWLALAPPDMAKVTINAIRASRIQLTGILSLTGSPTTLKRDHLSTKEG